MSSSLMPDVRKRRKPLFVRQPERCVARARQLSRAVHEALEHVVDRQLGRDRQHRVADGLQRPG